jgi:hypothetical protein
VPHTDINIERTINALDENSYPKGIEIRDSDDAEDGEGRPHNFSPLKIDPSKS